SAGRTIFPPLPAASAAASLVQLIVPDNLRGRVMSIYMVAFRGGMPLGSLVAGAVASRMSAPIVLPVNGLLILAVACYFMIRSRGVRHLCAAPPASTGRGPSHPKLRRHEPRHAEDDRGDADERAGAVADALQGAHGEEPRERDA